MARFDQNGNRYDAFSYKYHKSSEDRLIRNRLYHLWDYEPNSITGDAAVDIPETPSTERVFVNDDDDINQDNNYGYDHIGNLIRDNREGIETIRWTTSGKVREVLRVGGSTAPILRFSYDAGGHRLIKRVDLPDGSERTEYYIRDAQGNVMATYTHRFTPATGNDPDISLFHVVERPMYGSSRLGVDAQEVDLATATPAAPTTAHPGQWRYELTDHLGNVQAVVTEELLGLDANNDESVDQWAPVLLSAQDYEAGGSLLPGRNYSSDSYRLGFNGQEKDDEVFGATGTSYTAEFWQYDPRVARRWNLDPVFAPWESGYAVFRNNPIFLNDPYGDCADCKDPPPEAGPDGKGGIHSGMGDHLSGQTKGGLPSGWHEDGESPTASSSGSSSSSGGNSPSLFPGGGTPVPKPGGGGGLRGPTVSQGRPNYAFDVKPPSKGNTSNSTNPGLNQFNVFLNSATAFTGTIGKLAEFDSQTIFRYSERVNGRVVSAAELTNKFQGNALRVMNVTSKLGTVLGVTGLVTGALDLNSSVEQHGWFSTETAISTFKLGTSAVLFGFRANPIGAGLGIAWGIGNALYDTFEQE